jgi:hypothetical protein
MGDAERIGRLVRVAAVLIVVGATLAVAASCGGSDADVDHGLA